MLITFLLGGCINAAAPVPSTPTVTVASETTVPVRPVPTPTTLPGVQRLIGIGDVHGDFDAARAVLRLAGVLDNSDHWIGGETVVVQVGDQLDRGDGEQAILELFEQLAEEAFAAGGGFYPLIGNHESMNVQLDLRYVTEGGFKDFAEFDDGSAWLKKYDEAERGRVAAFAPGGPMANILAQHNVVQVVGDTLFVHGGIVPSVATYGIAQLNLETQQWMLGKGKEPAVLSGDDSPVWSRHYSDEPDDKDCALLNETLNALSLSRMVVAHTVQDGGINSACDDKVWRVDVGMSAHYGGEPAALEITADGVVVLTK